MPRDKRACSSPPICCTVCTPIKQLGKAEWPGWHHFGGLLTAAGGAAAVWSGVEWSGRGERIAAAQYKYHVGSEFTTREKRGRSNKQKLAAFFVVILKQKQTYAKNVKI